MSKKSKKKQPKKPRSASRRFAVKLGTVGLILFAIWGGIGEWYVHHSKAWLDQQSAALPKFVTNALLYLGNPLGDFTDALDWTGHDAVYEYDTEAPNGEVVFAGFPRRTGKPAPDDIRILSRGEFVIGWSDSLRHPVWVAYHVIKEAKYPDDGKRPSFIKDKEISTSPAGGDYAKSGFDRGHMAPNHAILTRYGAEVQRKTFLMTNIAPQLPALNRGIWRKIEHRIADLWTARYGEIWVVVGAIPSRSGQKLATNIDIPDSFYQVIVAQEGMNVRALAILVPKNIHSNAYATRNIVTIDELETLTGLDFNPELPEFIQSPLEAELPTRLWPVCAADAVKVLID